MRFRLCGDADAPDWLLAEIATISRLSSVRVKVLVGQIITRLVGGELDYEKVGKLASGTVSDSDVRAAVAALHFVLVSSAKHSVEEAQLAKELLQLGLPKEHAEAVTRPYAQRGGELRAALVQATCRLGCGSLSRWEVRSELGGGGDGGGAGPQRPHALLHLALAPAQQQAAAVTFRVEGEQLALLLHELRGARAALARTTQQPAEGS